NIKGKFMYSILIVEDDELQFKNLKSIISKYKPDWKIYYASSLDEGYQLALTYDIQLFFMDVMLDASTKELNDNNGVFLGYKLRHIERYKNTPFIFITSCPEEITRAVNDLHCYSYILKPYMPEDIINAIDSVTASPLMGKPKLSFRDPSGIRVKLSSDDIILVESSGHLLLIHTTTGIFETRDFTLNGIMKLLSHDFVRCHKKYIVNILWVETFDRPNNYIGLRSIDKPIPVGRTYKNTLVERNL
ncbi:MAG: LytR/AlgR family response regulator transcription factor, partial [Eubacterium sp.]